MHCYFDERVATAPFDQLHPSGLAEVADHPDAGEQFLLRGSAECAVDLRAIGFAHAIPRVSNPLCEIPVIRDDQQAFRVRIQTPDGEKPLVMRRQKVYDPLTSKFILICADESTWFVDEIVDRTGRTDDFAVTTDFLAIRIGFCPQFRNENPIDTDSPIGDELFTRAARAEPGRRQNLLQALNWHGQPPVLRNAQFQWVFRA